MISRKLSGEASLEELRELQQWLDDNPEMAYKADLYTAFFEHPPRREQSDAKHVASWEKLQSKLAEAFPENFGNNIIADEPAPSVFAVYKKWIAIAASLVLITITCMFFLHYNIQEKQLAEAATSTNEMNTMPGTRSKTVLPDGTVVWLNSDSRITYNADFGQTQREVMLTGEAFFDVAHNAEVPMIVHAKNVNIRVKGTAFNVRSYPESKQVETSLIRGSVELTTNADPERKILLKPNEKIVVDVVPDTATVIAVNAISERTPVKVSTATNKSLYHIEQLQESRFNIIPEISWVQNRLVFDNEVFTEVISKMEKWYNVKIILENNTLAVKNFSGAFAKEDITTALQALQLINDFHFEIKDGVVYIK